MCRMCVKLGLGKDVNKKGGIATFTRDKIKKEPAKQTKQPGAVKQKPSVKNKAGKKK